MKEIRWLMLVVCWTMAANLSRDYAAAREPMQPKSDVSGDTAKLIQDLGNARQKIREDAQHRLLAMPGALPAVRVATKSPDAEVARRAGQIVLVLLQRQYLKQMETEGVDLFLERFIKADDIIERDAGWSAVLELARTLLEREQRQFGNVRADSHSERREGDFAKLMAMHNWMQISEPASKVEVNDPQYRFLVRAQAVSSKNPVSGVFAVSSDLSLRALAGQSVVLAGGPVHITHGAVGGAIVVCDGDVTSSGIEGSIVIASGKVWTDSPVRRSLVICAGSLYTGRNNPSVKATTKEHEPALLGWVKFFQTADVGIEVVATKDAVVASKVQGAKPFARSGVKPGDVIIAIDGATVSSLDAFRRLLRSKVAIGRSTVLKIKRADEEMDVAVSFQPDAGGKQPSGSK